MKILVLNPFAGDMRELERCRSVARPDTEILFENIAASYPLNYVTYIYYRHECADAVIERVLSAQEQGFDAVFISCCYDPGLMEAREIVDIPVTAAFEAGVHYVNAISQRYSVIATEPKTVHCYRELAQLYGTAEKLASVRHIDLSARESYPESTSPGEVLSRVLEVARKCVEEDGAEAVLMGCTLQSCPVTMAGAGGSIGAPIIDPVLIGFKATEFMVELRRAGLPVISRYGTWQKPPAEELERLRRLRERRKSDCRQSQSR
jgi:allantoin racemase